jgi:hypothetical protein
MTNMHNMKKFFSENGFLTKDGEKFLMGVQDSIRNTMAQDEVHDMTDDELRALGSNMAKMVGEAISMAFSRRFQLEAKMNSMTDEQFYTYLKEKYGDSWMFYSLESEELKRVPISDWNKILKENKYVGEKIRKFVESNKMRLK